MFSNIIDHNKCPSSEKENQKCILRKSYFHQIQPRHRYKKKMWEISKVALFRNESMVWRGTSEK